MVSVVGFFRTAIFLDARRLGSGSSLLALDSLCLFLFVIFFSPFIIPSPHDPNPPPHNLNVRLPLTPRFLFLTIPLAEPQTHGFAVAVRSHDRLRQTQPRRKWLFGHCIFQQGDSKCQGQGSSVRVQDRVCQFLIRRLDAWESERFFNCCGRGEFFGRVELFALARRFGLRLAGRSLLCDPLCSVEYLFGNFIFGKDALNCSQIGFGN